LTYARDVIAQAKAARAASVRIINPFPLTEIDPKGGTREPPQGWDAADAVGEWRGRFHEFAKLVPALTPDAFAEKYPAKALDPSVSKVPKPPFYTFETRPAAAFPENRLDWPEPKPLPVGSICLPEFDLDFLPESLRPWIADIQDRMQCSTDFLGVTALVALGSLIGNKVGIRPRRKDDWIGIRKSVGRYCRPARLPEVARHG
jgi:hypothetical protein